MTVFGSGKYHMSKPRGFVLTEVKQVLLFWEMRGGEELSFGKQLFHKDITEWVGEWKRLPMLPTIDPSEINIKK